MKTNHLLFTLVLIIGGFSLSQAQVSTAFKHTTTSSNNSGNVSYFDNAACNATPGAIIISDHNFGPSGGNYHDTTTGIWYSNNQSKWSVYNESNSYAMPEDLDFNVLVAGSDATAFIHVATAASITAAGTHRTQIDHSMLNDNPNAVFFVSHNWVPNSVYNTNVDGIWYNTNSSRWEIYNEDFSTMEEDAAFNIVIPNSSINTFKHTSATANITSNYTVIDNAAINGDPNAIIFFEHDWTSTQVYHTHRMGVWYNGSNWAIYNEDLTNMQEDVAFNIMAYPSNPSSIDDQLVDHDAMTISPNPVSQSAVAVIEIDNEVRGAMSLKVTDLSGKIVLDTEVRKTSNLFRKELSVNNLPKGVYLVQLRSDELISTQKLVVQ